MKPIQTNRETEKEAGSLDEHLILDPYSDSFCIVSDFVVFFNAVIPLTLFIASVYYHKRTIRHIEPNVFWALSFPQIVKRIVAGIYFLNLFDKIPLIQNTAPLSE